MSTILNAEDLIFIVHRIGELRTQYQEARGKINKKARKQIKCEGNQLINQFNNVVKFKAIKSIS